MEHLREARRFGIDIGMWPEPTGDGVATAARATTTDAPAWPS